MTNEERYHAWVKESNLSPLTGTQAQFAKWLLEDEQVERLSVVGDLGAVFSDVYSFIRANRDKL